MDRWELSLGDSLTQKIEGALTEANAILVIISKSSVKSNWCKRELSAGLIRELEERKTLVMPCVIDDCTIPLFLRDKLYADFQKNSDEAFNLVDKSLAKISNPLQGRVEQPKFHTDWSVDWIKDSKGVFTVRWTFVDHSHDLPYVILSQCNILFNKTASNELSESIKKNNMANHLRNVLNLIISAIQEDELSKLITDQFEKFVAWQASGEKRRKFDIVFTYRRMGIDNGMDTIIRLGNNLRIACAEMTDKLFEPDT